MNIMEIDNKQLAGGGGGVGNNEMSISPHHPTANKLVWKVMIVIVIIMITLI